MAGKNDPVKWLSTVIIFRMQIAKIIDLLLNIYSNLIILALIFKLDILSVN